MNKTLFIITLFIMCIGLCALNCTPDIDIWARLIAGGYICENLAIPKTDFLSYSPTHIWYDHEWGASVIFYIIFKYFGSSGLIILKGLLVFTALFICYKTIDLRKPKTTVSYNILYYSIMFLAINRSLGAVIRCLLFTYIFFALYLYILERSRQNKNKSLIFLPVIMMFWCNIHGGFISGLGLILLYCLGELLNKRSIKKYLYALIGCLAVLFINPYGIEYVKFLFSAALMKREYITEWQSPFIYKNLTLYIIYKLILIFVTITTLFKLIKNKISLKEIDITKILIILVTMCLSIKSLRHIPFFIICAGVFLYDDFYSIFKLNTNKTFNLLKNVIIYFLIIAISFPLFISKKEIKITETKYPRFAIEFIKINNLKGNLFINFDWGSYAEYKLYPNNKIVMDGRYEEVYYPDLMDKLKNFHLVENDWYKVIREHPADVMVLEKKYPVFNKILNHPDWELVFDNNLSGVFVPKKKLKDKYIYPPASDNHYNDNLFKTDIKY